MMRQERNASPYVTGYAIANITSGSTLCQIAATDCCTGNA